MDKETRSIEKKLLKVIEREQIGKFRYDAHFALIKLTAEAKAKGLNDLAEALETANSLTLSGEQ